MALVPRNTAVKDIRFKGSSLKDLREFPEEARREAGYQLDRVAEPPMPDVGAGVHEIRIRDSAGTFRVLYVAKFEDAVYVLHCFQKKTQRTSRTDLDVACKRYAEVIKELKR